MSIFLVGGGPDTTTSPGLLGPFRAEFESHAQTRGRTPRLAIALFDHEGSADHYLPVYMRALAGTGPVTVRPVLVQPGHTVGPEEFTETDGIVVGGGPTPDYLAGLRSVGHAIRAAVTSGVPYLGFSAGAMIASSTALVGGYQLAGQQLCPSEWSEGLDAITLHPGLGLVPFSVDVHTAQAGTLGRTIALVASGEVATAVGIDENTCLTLRQPDAGLERSSITGTGAVWLVNSSGKPGPVVVSRARATETPVGPLPNAPASTEEDDPAASPAR